jgi:hypothetical protein
VMRRMALRLAVRVASVPPDRTHARIDDLLDVGP